MSTEKTKNTPQSLTSGLILWLLPLPMAISVFFVQGMMASYVRDLLTPAGPSLIYLSMFINNGEQLACVTAYSLSLLVVYGPLMRRQGRRAIVVFGSAAVFLVCIATLLAGGSTGISRYNKILQSLSTTDHVYQLIDQAECHHGCSHSYVILECDQAGWICHNYGTSSERVMMLHSCDHPIPVVSLAQNPTTHQLEMTVDGEAHVVNPADDILIYGYSWDRCGVGLKR